MMSTLTIPHFCKIPSKNEDFCRIAFLLLKEFILLTPECLWGNSFFKRYNVVERNKIDCKSEFSNTKIKEQWNAFDMVASAVVPNVMFFDFLYHADDWRLCVASYHNDIGQDSYVTGFNPFCNIGKTDIVLFDYPFLSLHPASTGKSSYPLNSTVWATLRVCCLNVSLCCRRSAVTSYTLTF